MSPANGFRVGWAAGTSAQIEIFAPGSESSGAYRLRYTAPFRATIRPPLEELRLGAGELNPIRDRLNGLVPAAARRGAGTLGLPESPVLERVQLVGSILLTLVVPSDVQTDMRSPGLYLEVGVDEALLAYPWELMHDDDEFLCLKHFVGRFVNLTKPAIPSRRHPEAFAPGPLSVLLISVPQPQPRQGVAYERLTAAEAETQAMVKALTSMGPAVQVSLLNGPKATYDGVYKAIRGGRYHIVHFNGHAYFNEAQPNTSSLVLFDRDMSTGPIVAFFGSRPPVFFFMNACETAATGASSPDWRKEYDIFGLARSFLETGAYLIGNRWQVGDVAAAAFGKAFYASLLDEKPLGQAMQEARVACRAASSADDLSWASYVFYGDPRLHFAKVNT